MSLRYQRRSDCMMDCEASSSQHPRVKRQFGGSGWGGPWSGDESNWTGFGGRPDVTATTATETVTQKTTVTPTPAPAPPATSPVNESRSSSVASIESDNSPSSTQATGGAVSTTSGRGVSGGPATKTSIANSSQSTLNSASESTASLTSGSSVPSTLAGSGIETTSHSLSPAARSGLIAAGVLISLLLAAIAAYFLILRKRRRRSRKGDPTPYAVGNLENGTSHSRTVSSSHGHGLLPAKLPYPEEPELAFAVQRSPSPASSVASTVSPAQNTHNTSTLPTEKPPHRDIRNHHLSTVVSPTTAIVLPPITTTSPISPPTARESLGRQIESLMSQFVNMGGGVERFSPIAVEHGDQLVVLSEPPPLYDQAVRR